MSDMSDEQQRSVFTRRKVVAGASIGAGSLIAAQAGLRANAQDDATPAPEEGQDAPVDPESTPQMAGPAIPPEVTEFANDWPVAQGNLFADRASKSSTIDTSTVSTLGVAWELPLDAQSGFGAITSNPVVQGNTIYLIDNRGNVYSIDRETGEVNWRNDYNVDTLGPNGIAVGYGYLVSVLGDSAEVLGHRADTGELVWRFKLANHNALGITMAPLIYDNYVIVSTEPGGNSRAIYEGGANGVVYCLDVTTGVTLWTWDTVEEDLWGNFRVNSGGGLWYPPSVDEDGILYMGIGNAGPFPGTEEFPNATSRPGDNDYANNIVALDPNAGRVLWNRNINPHDLIDLDNQETPVLADVTDDAGITRKMVFTGGKHGFVVGLYRGLGKEVWRVPVGRHENDDLPEYPDGDGIVVYPGVLGGINAPLAYADGRVFAATFNFGTPYSATEFGFNPEGYAVATGNFVAIDALSGQILWDIELPTGLAGPGPTIANDVVFIGGLDGIVRGYNVVDGTLVWSYQAAAGLNAPFAIAGDMLLVPAGSFIVPSSDTQGEPPAVAASLIAFKVGSSEATPVS